VINSKLEYIEPRAFEMYVNIHEGPAFVCVYKSREEADKGCVTPRIACKKIRIEIKPGEEFDP